MPVSVVPGIASDAGVKNFIASGSLLGDLGSQYVASWVGQLITAGAMVSAFGCALACAVGAARLLGGRQIAELNGPAGLGDFAPAG